MHFYKGQLLEWKHGGHVCIAEVLKVFEDEIYIQGIRKKYWISKKTMSKKINKH